jgi:sulfur carrier protein
VITVRLNGTDHSLPADATLADAVALLTDRPSGIAVALDAEVMPRSAWADTPLRAGARVEVLTAVQGG